MQVGGDFRVHLSQPPAPPAFFYIALLKFIPGKGVALHRSIRNLQAYAM